MDVIKYEGDHSTFIWKHPIEDFYTGTQLIVHETQEAVFYMNGQALDSFGPGRHTLETQNLPLLGRLLARPFGGKTPFHCEVYFINKTEQMALRWGTDSKAEYVEPSYNFPIQIGASGEMSLRVSDGRKLLNRLVGTTAGLSRQELMQYFRGILMLHVKSYMTGLIREKRISIFSIDEHLAEMSEALHRRLIPDFEDYGLSLERFFVNTIVKPEDDPSYRRFKEIHFRKFADVEEAELRRQVGVIDQQTQAQRMVIEAQALAQKRALEGYSYQEERSFDVAERVASNNAVAPMSNLGIGLGVMGGVGTVVGGTLKNALGGMNRRKCPKCGMELPEGARFCFGCGEKLEGASAGLSCPKCGKPSPGGKFCMHCGAPMQQSCPDCGAALNPGAKFCPECGRRIEA